MKLKSEIEIAKNLGLDEDEYKRILHLLKRTPNHIELCMFASMWSEHCSYKNSLFYLKNLYRKGEQILNEGLSENAGLVDIGGEYACAFKIESHNHPSAVEPFQGAATGVGGINRDIFTMGARPFAQLISLRFGDISKKDSKSLRLMKGVLNGISHYGNAFGVPILGGDILFDASYNDNPLVNVLSAGLVKKSEILNAVASGVGNPVFIAGSATGKDGINGAVFASANITEDSEYQLPSIQVGDPFAEKLLMEACLEAAKTGDIIAIQDMGAAGILCSTSEMAARGKCGMKIHLDKVPLRQKNMLAEEIILSESQERMLVILEKGREKKIEEIFKKWKVPLVQIGEVIDEKTLKYIMHGVQIAEVNPSHLVAGEGAPVYEREMSKPKNFQDHAKYEISSISLPENLNEVGDHLLAHINICSKDWAFSQFDSMIGCVNMNTNNAYNASLLKIKEADKILCLSISGHAEYVYANPEIGAMIGIAEAAAKIYCTAARPLAISNCLNFGNPYDKEVYWQFVKVIQGMNKACERFNTPITGGNVSFYNQSEINGKNRSILPSPVFGMLGILDEARKALSLKFKSPNDLIYILGKTHNDISSSTYLSSYHKIKHSPTPYFNLDEEIYLMHCTQNLIETGLLQSAKRIASGGLYFSLLECIWESDCGFEIETDKEVRKDAFLFGESQGRILVSVSPEKEKAFSQKCVEENMYFFKAGIVISGGDLRIDQHNFGRAHEKKEIFDGAFEKYL